MIKTLHSFAAPITNWMGYTSPTKDSPNPTDKCDQVPSSLEKTWTVLTSEESEKAHANRASWVKTAQVAALVAILALLAVACGAPFYCPSLFLSWSFIELQMARVGAGALAGIFLSKVWRAASKEIHRIEDLQTHTKALRECQNTSSSSSLQDHLTSDTYFYGKLDSAKQAELTAKIKDSLAFFHIRAHQAELTSLETEIEKAKENLNPPDFIQIINDLKKGLILANSDLYKTLCQEAILSCEKESEEKEKVKALGTLAIKLKAELLKAKVDEQTAAYEPLIKRVEEEYNKWSPILRQSLEKRADSVFSLERRLLEKKVCLIFLYTFTLQEDGDARFEAAIKKHGVRPENALYDIAIHKKWSVAEHSIAKQYGQTEEADTLFSLSNNETITKSEIEDQTQWFSILQKLQNTINPLKQKTAEV
jgi:hypothetical protein